MFIVPEEADGGNQLVHFANTTRHERDSNTNKAGARAEAGNLLIAFNNALPESNLPGGGVQLAPSSAIVPVRPMCLSVALSPQLHAGVQLSRIIILLDSACTVHIVTQYWLLGINLLSVKQLSSRATGSGVLFRAGATLLDAQNQVMGYSPEPRHRGDLYPLICSIVSGDTKRQLQIEDAKTVAEFQANNSRIGNQPIHNLVQGVERPDQNSGPAELLSDTPGRLVPNLKGK